MKENNFEHSREAAKITLNKVKSWEDLNAATMAEADEKFKEVTKETWKDFAVSGTLQFDQKEGKQVLRPFTDLDGRSAIAILEKAGIDTSGLTYIRPGEFLKGAINLDTGDKFGVVYEEPTYTAYFDHHAKSTEVTSTTEIMYKTMVDLGMIEASQAMNRLVKFVNDIDNRKLPPGEFLNSGKTIIGVQRDLDFTKMLAYFSEHESPTDILTPEELERYGLRESAERQQKTVDESMAKLEEMEQQGKIINTQYGKIVVNENNELRTGSSAAYVKYDGIINFSSDKSFAVTLKDKDLDEQALRQKLGDKFQGKIIRGKMWIYNDKEPLNLTLEDIKEALAGEKEKSPEQIKAEISEIRKLIVGLGYYGLQIDVPPFEGEMADLNNEHSDVQSDWNLGLADANETLKKASDIFYRMKQIFLNRGVSEDLISEDRLKGYIKMLEAEDSEWDRKLEKANKQGTDLFDDDGIDKGDTKH